MTEELPTSKDLNLAGYTLLASGQSRETAERIFRLAVKQDPYDAMARHNLGSCLSRRGEHIEAAQHLATAVGLLPSNAASWNELGTAYLRAGRYKDGLLCAETAASLKPDESTIWHQLAAHYEVAHDYDKCEKAYANCMALNAADHRTRFEWAMIKMLRGNFEHGLPMYESRNMHFEQTTKLDNPVEIATTEPDLVDRIIVLSEQGVGDLFQMSRYAAMLKRHFPNAELNLWCKDDLVPIMQRFPDWDEIIPWATDIEPKERSFTIGSMSLMYVAQLLGESIYQPVPELDLSGTELFGPADKVGICWKGNPDHPNDRYRSIPDDDIKKLLDYSSSPAWLNFTPWLKLQSGMIRGDIASRLIHRPYESWDDTIRAIRSCKLVITCDTACAHLSAIVGVPVWLLESRVCDWRWRSDAETSPWYPTVTIFRQAEALKWEPVLEFVGRKLEVLYGKESTTDNDESKSASSRSSS